MIQSVQIHFFSLRNCTSLITQGPKINDLLLTAIEECCSGSEEDVKVEFLCWDFLFLYCSSFGKLVSLSAGDLKVLIKHLKGYIEVKDATVQVCFHSFGFCSHFLSFFLHFFHFFLTISYKTKLWCRGRERKRLQW